MRSVSVTQSWGRGLLDSSLMSFVFVSVAVVPPMSPMSFPAVFVPVTPLSVFILLLIFVHVMMFVVRMASGTAAVTGRRPAALAASVRRVPPLAPSRGRVSVTGLDDAPLRAGGTEGVEEEPLVGAPQGTLQPSRGGRTF